MLFTAWTVGVNYNSRPTIHMNSGRELKFMPTTHTVDVGPGCIWPSPNV
jgi:hypothetical protein